MKNKSSSIYYNRAIFILSIIGVLLAAYVFQSFVRKSPIVCINSGCEIVRQSPYSYILGIPVPGVGLVGYSLLALFAFLRTVPSAKKNSEVFLKGILAISIFGVFFVSWFTYMEFFVIRGVCTWCAVSAVNMLIIFLLSRKMYFLERRK